MINFCLFAFARVQVKPSKLNLIDRITKSQFESTALKELFVIVKFILVNEILNYIIKYKLKCLSNF